MLISINGFSQLSFIQILHSLTSNTRTHQPYNSMQIKQAKNYPMAHLFILNNFSSLAGDGYLGTRSADSEELYGKIFKETK